MVVPVAGAGPGRGPWRRDLIGGTATRTRSPPSSTRSRRELVRELAPVIVGRVGLDETAARPRAARCSTGSATAARTGRRQRPRRHGPATTRPCDVLRPGARRRARRAPRSASTGGRGWSAAPRARRRRHRRPGAVVGADLRRRRPSCTRELSAQEALNEQFEALIELVQDFIAIADLDGGVTYVNRAGRELVGLGPTRRALGRPTEDYFTDRRPVAVARDRGGGARPRLLGGRDRSCATSAPARRSRSPPTPSWSPAPPTAPRWRSPPCSATCAPRHAARSRRWPLRIQEQRAIAELGPAGADRCRWPQLMARPCSWSHARYPLDWSPGCMQRSADGRTAGWWRPRCPTGCPSCSTSTSDSLTGRALVAQRAGLHRGRGRRPGVPARRGDHPVRDAQRAVLPDPRRRAAPGASSAPPAPTPGTGATTTSRSSSRWPRRWGPPYAGTTWRRSCSTRRCTTR